MWGVVPGTGEGFEALLPEPRKLPQSPVLRVLACCHSVTLLNERLIGDPLDLKMIHSTGWVRNHYLPVCTDLCLCGFLYLSIHPRARSNCVSLSPASAVQ